MQVERSQRTRRRLAEAAIECLVEVGYRHTTFVEVCRRAGLTRGAAHHHYRDMPALMLDALVRLNGRVVEQAQPAVQHLEGTEERVDSGIGALWDVFTRGEFRAAVEIWMAQSHDPELRERILPEMERFSEVLAEGFSRFFPELVDQGGEAVHLMRFVFLAMIGIGLVNATFDPRDGDPERERMLALLKRLVQRELAVIAEDRPAASVA
jgi:AcrR family transcriptional regulator